MKKNYEDSDNVFISYTRAFTECAGEPFHAIMYIHQGERGTCPWLHKSLLPCGNNNDISLYNENREGGDTI